MTQHEREPMESQAMTDTLRALAREFFETLLNGGPSPYVRDITLGELERFAEAFHEATTQVNDVHELCATTAGCHYAFLSGICDSRADELAKQQSAHASLVQEMEKYLQHQPDCYWNTHRVAHCTCGLTEKLATLRRSSAPHEET